MQITYLTTSADYRWKLERFASASKVTKVFAWCAYLTICGLAWVSAWRFWDEQRDQNDLYVLSIGTAALLTVSLPWLYSRYQDAFLKSVINDEHLIGLIGPTTLELGDQDVVETRLPVTVRAPWADVRAMERAQRHIVLVVAPLIAIVIPHSAFGTDHDRLVFEQEILRRIERPQA